jgi:hypothetical protein
MATIERQMPEHLNAAYRDAVEACWTSSERRMASPMND